MTARYFMDREDISWTGELQNVVKKSHSLPWKKELEKKIGLITRNNLLFTVAGQRQLSDRHVWRNVK